MKTKKYLSMLLVFAMMLGMLPGFASAAVEVGTTPAGGSSTGTKASGAYFKISDSTGQYWSQKKVSDLVSGMKIEKVGSGDGKKATPYTFQVVQENTDGYIRRAEWSSFMGSWGESNGYVKQGYYLPLTFVSGTDEIPVGIYVQSKDIDQTGDRVYLTLGDATTRGAVPFSYYAGSDIVSSYSGGYQDKDLVIRLGDLYNLQKDAEIVKYTGFDPATDSKVAGAYYGVRQDTTTGGYSGFYNDEINFIVYWSADDASYYKVKYNQGNWQPQSNAKVTETTSTLKGNTVEYSLRDTYSTGYSALIYKNANDNTTYNGATAEIDGSKLTITFGNEVPAKGTDKIYVVLTDGRAAIPKLPSQREAYGISVENTAVDLELAAGTNTVLNKGPKTDVQFKIQVKAAAATFESGSNQASNWVIYTKGKDTNGVYDNSGRLTAGTDYTVSSNGNTATLTVLSDAFSKITVANGLWVVANSGAFATKNVETGTAVKIEVEDSSAEDVTQSQNYTAAALPVISAGKSRITVKDLASGQGVYYALFPDTEAATGKARAQKVMDIVKSNTSVDEIKATDGDVNWYNATIRSGDNFFDVDVYRKDLSDTYVAGVIVYNSGSDTWKVVSKGITGTLTDGISKMEAVNKKEDGTPADLVVPAGTTSAAFTPIDLSNLVTGGIVGTNTEAYYKYEMQEGFADWLTISNGYLDSKTSGYYPSEHKDAGNYNITVRTKATSSSANAIDGVEVVIPVKVGEVLTDTAVTATATGSGAMTVGKAIGDGDATYTVSLTGGTFSSYNKDYFVLGGISGKTSETGIDYTVTAVTGNNKAATITLTGTPKKEITDNFTITIKKAAITEETGYAVPAEVIATGDISLSVGSTLTLYYCTDDTQLNGGTWGTLSTGSTVKAYKDATSTTIELDKSLYEAKTGYELTGWEFYGVSISSSKPVAGLSIDGDSVIVTTSTFKGTNGIYVKPVFEKIAYTCTIKVDGDPAGVRVVGSSGLQSAGDGTYTVEVKHGDSLTFSVNTTSADYQIVSVKNGETALTGTSGGQYSIANITGDAEITITVKAVEYDVAITQPTNGTLTVNGKTESFTASKGTILTIAATADKSYKLSSILVDGEALQLEDGETSGTYTMGTQAVEIAATFEEDKAYVAPDAAAESVVNVATDTDAEGNVITVATSTSEITAEAVEDAVYNATADSISLDMSANTATDSLAVMTADKTEIEATIPAAAVTALAESATVESADIKTDAGDMNVPQDTFQAIASNASVVAGGTPYLSVNKSTTASKELGKNTTVLSAFSVDFKVKTDTTSSATDEKVEIKDVKPITLSFFIGIGLKDNLTVKYLNEQGKLENVYGTPSYNPTTGIITFQTTHLSEFVVIDPDNSPVTLNNIATDGTPSIAGGKKYTLQFTGNTAGSYLFIMTQGVNQSAGISSIELNAGMKTWNVNVPANTTVKVWLSTEEMTFDETYDPQEFTSEDGEVVNSYDSETGLIL